MKCSSPSSIREVGEQLNKTRSLFRVNLRNDSFRFRLSFCVLGFQFLVHKQRTITRFLCYIACVVFVVGVVFRSGVFSHSQNKDST